MLLTTFYIYSKLYQKVFPWMLRARHCHGNLLMPVDGGNLANFPYKLWIQLQQQLNNTTQLHKFHRFLLSTAKIFTVAKIRKSTAFFEIPPKWISSAAQQWRQSHKTCANLASYSVLQKSKICSCINNLPRNMKLHQRLG